MTQIADTIEPGAYDIGFTDYLGIDAINFSSIEPHRISAKEAHFQMTRPPLASESQVNGEATHAALLEPERFATEYVAMPKFEGHPNSTAHRTAKAEWLKANADKITLTHDEMAGVMAMQSAAMRHAIAGPILSAKGRCELAIVWRDKEFDCLCKGRIDKLTRLDARLLGAAESRPVVCIVDIKTTRRMTLDQFDRDFASYAYHAQLASYRDGLHLITGSLAALVVIAIQNGEPFDVSVRWLPEDQITVGQALYRRLLKQHLDCQRSGTWPGIAEGGIIPITLPAWAQAEGRNHEWSE